MTDEEAKIRVDLILKAIKELREHWDTVHILCTNVDVDKESEYTDYISKGAGNVFARVESARRWIRAEETREAIKIRKEEESDDQDSD